MSASGAHYEAERAEHLRNADEELEGGVGEDIGIFKGVAQRRGTGTYYTQAEVDEIMRLPDPRPLAVDPDRFLRELDDKRVEVGKRLNKEGGKEVENVEDVRITVDGVEFIPDGLSSSEALANAVLEARRAALAALRRFTACRVFNADDETEEERHRAEDRLVELLAADECLEAAERALEEAE